MVNAPIRGSRTVFVVGYQPDPNRKLTEEWIADLADFKVGSSFEWEYFRAMFNDKVIPDGLMVQIKGGNILVMREGLLFDPIVACI